MVAPATALSMLGSATTLGVNLAPLRYLTFSFVSLMICVSGLPSIISSCTYILTSLSKTSCLRALRPRMRMSAEPKLPLRHTKIAEHAHGSRPMVRSTAKLGEVRANERHARPLWHGVRTRASKEANGGCHSRSDHDNLLTARGGGEAAPGVLQGERQRRHCDIRSASIRSDADRNLTASRAPFAPPYRTSSCMYGSRDHSVGSFQGLQLL